MWRQSHANHAGSRSSAESLGATPRSDAIVRSPSAPTRETTMPFRPPIAGPATSTPRASSSAVTTRPARSSPRFETVRACEPSATDHAATFAACPPGAVSVIASASAPEESGSPSRTITSRSASPRVTTSTTYDRPMDGEQRGGKLGSFVVGGVLGASAALAAARRRRRLSQPDRPVFQGLEAFEGAPCYREIVEKERDELEA